MDMNIPNFTLHLNMFPGKFFVPPAPVPTYMYVRTCTCIMVRTDDIRNLKLTPLYQVSISTINYNAGHTYNLEREYRDCIKSKRDKIGITRHIMLHQVLYNVHVTLFIGQLHNI